MDKKKILYIEDNEDALSLMKNFLESLDYDMSGARTGKKGIEKAREINPDVIFVDIKLPDTDGFELCRMLKTNPATKRIPVMLVSAMDSMETTEKGFAAGAMDVFTKPVNFKRLKEKLANIFKTKSKLSGLACPASQSEARENPSYNAKKKILVIDDDTAILRLAEIKLSQAGFETLTAASGEEGLEKIGLVDINLALVDIGLPGINGFEVCKKIKDTAGMNFPVIIFTGQKMADLEEGFNYGADACFRKPPDWQALIKKMAELTGNYEQI